LKIHRLWCATKGIRLGDLEDSFDIEYMQLIEQQHKRRFQELAAGLGAAYPCVLALG
jgi:hypothetical protein